MKKVFLYISAFAVLVAGTTACDLNLVPHSSIAYQEGVQMITDATELAAYERGVMSSFRALQYGTSAMALDLCCDGFNATQNYGNNLGPLHRLDATFKADDNQCVDAIWGNNYIAIKNYNILLEALENIPESIEADAKIVKGETHFFRACSYLTLIRIYAKDYNPSTAATDPGVPLVLKYNQNDKPARASVAEIYKAIKDDLDMAAECLAKVPGKVRADKPTIDAVNAMYARYYLDIEDYGKAASYSDQVIKSAAGYKLASTAEEMETEFTKDNGDEPVLQLFSSKDELPNTNSFYTQVTSGSDVPLYFNSYYLPSQKLIDKYTAGDLRFAQWFSKDKYPTKSEGSYFTGEFYTFVRFIGNPDLQTGNVPAPRQMIKPITVAEMYLINAEANLANNQSGAAKTSLNTLQSKRGATTTEATAQNIQDEWFKETAGCGFRLSCIKRWNTGYTARYGQPGAIAAHVLLDTPAKDYYEKTVSADEKKLVWPIPSYDRNVNKNLTQNPGYDEV